MNSAFLVSKVASKGKIPIQKKIVKEFFPTDFFTAFGLQVALVASNTKVVATIVGGRPKPRSTRCPGCKRKIFKQGCIC